MDVLIGNLLMIAIPIVSVCSVLAVWGVLRLFSRSQKDTWRDDLGTTMKHCYDFPRVQNISLPPRRRTVDVLANPRPFPGTLRIDIHPAKDISGEWIADVQPVNIITQGRDMVHAIEAAAEAVQMCLEDDQANGLDFWTRGWQRKQSHEK